MEIITGRPHRLLDVCIRRIGERAAAGESCMLLVPAQYTLQAEMEVMERLNLKGSFLIDVLSPGRLQGRVFERAGQPQRVIFDERGKQMVLSEAIEQERESLTVYANAARNGMRGLVQKMSALIASLKQGGMTAQDVALAAGQLDERNPARGKLEDTARIYAAYEERMADKLADAEDVAGELRARLPRSGVLEGQHVFVYGFDVITPGFGDLLLDVAGLAASLTLAVETDKNDAPDGRLFAPVNYSLERLAKQAGERGVPICRTCWEGEIHAREDLRFLERHLYALGGEPYAGEPEHVELIAASGMRQEVHAAAARMRAMAADGEKSSEMAVVYPKGSGYAPLLENILPQYGLMPYVAEKRAGAAHPLSRFVLSALAVVSGGWRVADVTECVQTGFMGLTQEQMDALCAYCEGTDLRPGAFRRAFHYEKTGDEAALAALNDSRKQVAGPLERFQHALAQAQQADDAVRAVIALLEDVQAFDTLDDMRRSLEAEALFSEAQDCTQVWNALMETLDQLHTLIGSRRVTASLVLDLLAEGLSSLELAALPPAAGAVVCGEIGNVRTAQVRTLFAVGMNDVQGGADGGLLTEAESEEVARITGAYLGMRASERSALARLDELKTLCGARERVIVSYALADETGRALREGSAVQAIRRIFPALHERGGLPDEERRAMLCAQTPALEALAVHLSEVADGRSELDQAYASAAQALQSDGEGEEMLRRVVRRLARQPERRLKAPLARALYGRPVISASRLELFAQCPYRHFIRYGLSPQQELTPGVDWAELGTLYHEAADRFTRAVTACPEFPKVTPEVCDRLMDEAVAPLIETWRASPLGASARGASIARRIGKTARRTARSIVSQYEDSGFRPLQTELAFGQNGVAPIMLELGDGSFVYLQGRIDRIDVLEEDGRTIRVVDYKSGSKRFDPTLVYWGLQLQLLLYLAAALAQIPGARAAGFFYCRIADPTVKTDSRIREEVERQIAKRLSLAGISLSDVQILRAQGGRHAAMITREGKPNGRYAGSMADEQTLDAMVSYARRKAASLAGEAYAGVIEDAPAERGAFVACKTCSYAAICGFDPSRQSRRRLITKEIGDLR